MDYADILLKFLKLNKISKYKYVLVDELQDVNKIEAEIALKSGDNFIAVGDKKQAIFGFQEVQFLILRCLKILKNLY